MVDETPVPGSTLGKRGVIPPHLGLDSGALGRNSYLVDPASSHMLVSKIKPCMSKYKQDCTSETANGSLNQL